ncbi:MAG: hypothetical protein AAGB93_00145 [Planctomycetota bacterium]
MHTLLTLTGVAAAAAALASVFTPGSPGTDDEAPRELGAVDWGRKLEPALASAKESGKPVLLLFQEIPG